MARDIKLTQNKTTKNWDINFANGDFEITEGLDTALYLSVFAEARATEDQVPNPILRRGHFSNLFSPILGYEVGSLLWLYTQERLTPATESLIKGTVEDGLEWLIEDEIVNATLVETQKIENGFILNVNLSNKSQEQGNYYQLFVETFK